MAERLAADRSPVVVVSRPERARGRLRRRIRRLFLALTAVCVLLVVAVLLAYVTVSRSPARDVRASALIPAGQSARVLVVLARPGQELPMAATLASLRSAGVETAVLSLTDGEEQHPTLGVDRERVARIRASELARASDLLGAHRMLRGGLADGGLLLAPPETVTSAIDLAIEEMEPSVVMTVTDPTGQDRDSQVVGRYVLEVANRPDSGVARVWSVSRSEAESTWLGWAGAPLESSGPADVAVLVGSGTGLKRRALEAHGSLSPDLARSTYPGSDRIPAWAYFRFWDREYFDLEWGLPLDQ